MAFNLHKINGQVDLTSNAAALAKSIQTALSKIPATKIQIDSSSINKLNQSLKQINGLLKSTSNGLQQNIAGLGKGATSSANSVTNLGKSIKGSRSELEAFGASIGATIRRFSAFITVVGVFNSIKNSIVESGKEAISFEKEMVKISQVTGFALGDLGDLNKEITRLSTTLGVSSTKLVNVAQTLAQAGLTARDVKKALDTLAKTELSATFENIGQTTEGAIAIISQFGTKVDDLEGQLGSLSAVSAKFAVESGDLVTAVRKAGGAFQATGGSLNELFALFTSVRASTRESAEAIATGLRTIFARLERPKTIAFLKELGINLTDAKGEFLGVYKAVETLSSALKDVSGNDPRYFQILEEIGGYRQISRSIALLKEFETTQKALGVAQRAGNILSKDVVVAQQSIANQIARVNEEFNALIRSLIQDTAIKQFIHLSLQLASAMIKVADSIKPVVPLIGLVAGASLSKFIRPVGQGLLNYVNRPKGFNRGGIVPGTGSGDIVPASLEPGEFVIKKSAVQAFGAHNLGKINKYAGGGLIARLKAIRAVSKKQPGFKEAFKDFRTGLGDVKRDVYNDVINPFILSPGRAIKSGFGKVLDYGNKPGVITIPTPSLKGIGRGIKSAAGSVVDYFTPAPAPVSRNKRILDISRFVLRDLQKELGIKFDNSLVNRLRVTSSLSGEKTNTSHSDQIRGSFSLNKEISINSSKIKTIKDLRKTLLHELGHAIDLKVGRKNLASIISKNSSIYKIGEEESLNLKKSDKKNGLKFSEEKQKYRYSREEAFANAFRDYLLSSNRPSSSNHRRFKDIISKVSTKGYNKGGTVDNIPAMLTPGEFVVNKESAKAFGYGNLKKINKYAKGGIVDKIGGLGVGAGIFLPSLISQFAGDTGKNLGLDEDAIKPFLNAITTATTALIIFSTLLKRDAEGTKERLTNAQSDFYKKNDILTNKKISTTENKNKQLSDIANRPINEYKEKLKLLAEERKQLAERTKSANPLVAKHASNRYIDIDNQLKKTVSNYRKNSSSRSANIKDEQDALLATGFPNQEIQIRAAKREVAEARLERIRESRRLKKELEVNRTLDKIALPAAIGIAAGGALSSIADRNIALGNRKIGGVSTSGISAVGGALSGAGQGAFLGASIGALTPIPGGTAIGAGLGAATGGIYGFISALTEAESQLNKFDATQAFDKFKIQLNSVLSGRSTIGTQRININGFLEQKNKDFLTKSGSEFQSLTAEIGSSVEGLDSYLSKIIQLGGSTEDIIKTNENLILILSRFGNQGIKDVENRIKQEVEARGKQIKHEKDYAKIQEENNKRLSAIFNISGAVGDATRSTQNLNQAVETLGEFADGMVSIRSRFDFSALEDIGSSRLSDVSNQANRAVGLIGGSSGQLAQDVVESTRLIQNLPVVLNKLVNSNQLEGRDIELEFKDALGKGFAQDLLLSKFSGIIGGGTTTDFIKKFKEDPSGITKELQTAVGPIVNALKDSLPQIINQFDIFEEGLAKHRENFLRSLDGLIKIIDIEDLSADIDSSFFGKSRSLADRQGFEQQRFNTLSGGSNINQLGQRLISAQNNIQAIDEQLKQNPKDDGLRVERSGLLTELERVKKALEHSADVNSRLANIQQELEKLERTRSNKTNLAKDFVFGDAQAKLRIAKNIVSTGIVQNNISQGRSPLQGLSREMVEGVREITDFFSEDKLFNGLNGRELSNQIIKGTIGFDPDKRSAEELGVKAQKDQVVNNAREAAKILNDNITSSNDKFLVGLRQQFNDFFTNLKSSFEERAANERVRAGTINDDKANAIGERIDALKRIRKITGADVNDPNSISSIKGVVEGLSRSQKIRDELPSITGAGERFKKRGFVGTKELEGELGAQFTKDFNNLRTSNIVGGETPAQVAAIQKNRLNEFVNKAVLDETIKRNTEASKIEQELQENHPGALNFIKDLQELKVLFKELGENITPLNRQREERRQIEGEGFAKGGLIWKKRGTDTVPAMSTDGQPFMLTPGEMVMNRRAVGKYGPELKKMNYAANGASIPSVLRRNKKDRDSFLSEREEHLAYKNAKKSDPIKLPRPGSAPLSVFKGLPSTPDEYLVKKSQRDRFDPVNPISPVFSQRTASIIANEKEAEYQRKVGQARAIPKIQPSGTEYQRPEYVQNSLNRAAAQTARFNARMKSSEIQRGIIPGSRGEASITRDWFDSSKASVSYQNGEGRKFGQIDPSRINAPSGKPISRADYVPSTDEFQARRYNAPKVRAFNEAKEQARYARNAATNQRVNPTGNPFIGTLPTGPKSPQQNQQALAQQNSPPPQVMQEANKIAEKLNGMKMELVLSGTLNVNISEGNLSDKVKEHFRVAVAAYVDDKIVTSLNQLIGDANLAVLPRTAGKKEGKV